MSKQILIVLGILLVFGCADVSKEDQLQTGCSGGSESTPENEYVSPAPTPAPTPTDTTPTDTTSTVSSWTKQLGTSSSDTGIDITGDSSGNIYVTGNTGGDLEGNTSAGGFDIFVVKYNSSGTKQWTQQLGTSSTDYAGGIATDSSSNVYVTGHTQGGLDSNTNVGGQDLFVVKFNSSGTKQWTQQLGTSATEYGTGITTDSSGNVYVGGYTEGSLDGNTSAGESDFFVVKYNSSGVKQWTQQLGTSADDLGYSITGDSSGNVYVTGYTRGGLDGNTSAGKLDLFLIKYNSSGVKQWTQQLGTSAHDYGQGVTIDSSGNVYVVGRTEGSLDGNTSAGDADLFVVKYNSSGVKQWTQQLGTSIRDSGEGITSDSSGNVYVTGFTSGGLDGNSTAGGIDLFVVKYNSSGTKQWTRQLGTTSSDSGNGITSDSSDNVYVTGYTTGSLDRANTGNYDLIVVKYNSSGVKQ
jgi:hypothetical protein